MSPSARPAATDTEIRERVDEDGFELAYVRDDVALARAPLRERHDRVPDELAGTVVRDVATAVGPHERSADRLRRNEHVREIGARPERVDVRVLLEEQVVVGRPRVQAALQRLRLGVGHPPEPPRAQK